MVARQLMTRVGGASLYGNIQSVTDDKTIDIVEDNPDNAGKSHIQSGLQASPDFGGGGISGVLSALQQLLTAPADQASQPMDRTKFLRCFHLIWEDRRDWH